MQHDSALLLINATRSTTSKQHPSKNQSLQCVQPTPRTELLKMTKPVNIFKQNDLGQELTNVICPKVGRQLLVSIPCSAVQIAIELASLVLVVILWGPNLHAQARFKH